MVRAMRFLPRPETEQSAVEVLQYYGIVPTEVPCLNGHHMRLEFEDRKRKGDESQPAPQCRWRCRVRSHGQQCTASVGVRIGIVLCWSMLCCP